MGGRGRPHGRDGHTARVDPPSALQPWAWQGGTSSAAWGHAAGDLASRRDQHGQATQCRQGATQWAPRDTRRNSRGEWSPLLPLASPRAWRPDFPGALPSLAVVLGACPPISGSECQTGLPASRSSSALVPGAGPWLWLKGRPGLGLGGEGQGLPHLGAQCQPLPLGLVSCQ